MAGRYAVERLVGEGSLSLAYRARDRLHDDDVVLKVLRTDAPPEVLRREFAALRACRHPRLVRARDFGWDELAGRRRPFYVADLVTGVPLAEWWAGRSWDEHRAALIDVARALGALHRGGRRHGDVKPDNVRADAKGRATLLDLSCVAPLGEPARAVSGTPGYLAPELLAGDPVDERADLYALGVLWDRLGGEPPRSVRPLLARLRADDPRDRPTGVDEVLEILGAPVELHATRVDAGPFVGRDEVLDRFDALLDRLVARRDGPRALALVGAPGSGRTRALTELRWRAQLRLRTVEGRPERGIAELLGRALGRGVGAGLEDRLRAAAELGRSDSPTLLVLDDVPGAADLAATIPPHGSLGVVLTCVDAPRGSVEALPLAPLGPEAIAAWARTVGAGHVDPEELRQATGGLPRATAERLSRAALAEDWRKPPPRSLPRAAEGDARHAAAACAWLGGAGRQRLHELGVAEAAIDRALAAGWLRERDDGRLTATVRVEHGPDLAPTAERVLDRLGPARRAAVLLDLGREDEARRLARGWRDDPRGWLEVLERLGDAPALARAAVAAGDLRAAERALGRIEGGDREAALARAELALKRARPAEVLERLRDVPGAEAADLRARARLASADYAAARDEARDARRSGQPLDTRLDDRLRETIALAEGYLGEPRADQALAEVADAHAARDDHAGALRVTSYRGILAHLRGEWPAAVERFERALDIARSHALDDALASGWLNLGTARQEDGDWGGALEAYERGSRYAELLAQPGTEAMLRFNLANLAVEIGHYERARALAGAARRRAEALGLGHLEAPLRRLEAEIARGEGDLDAAERGFAEARARAEAQGASRDVIELTLLGGELALARGSLERADAAARAVERADEGSDLRARGWRLRGAVALARGDRAGAIRSGERALRASRDGARDLATADAHALLARAYTDAPDLAREHGAAARRVWQRIEATLPPTYRDAFRAHPRRASVPQPAPAAPQASPSASIRLRRFLEINRRLSASLDVDDVLERAMDAAIELSEAERGFVLLRRDGALEVAAARDLDRETVPSSHIAFSRSIAERVVESDEPVVTVDARSDERFATERSVHAMRLQSVACVPIRSGSSIRGALYLDNRFERGRFGEPDLELLQAFADQVAIALRNAELHEALEARTRALDAARAALEERVQGQAERIDALATEVEAKQRALEYRYDYDRIVGRGARMRSVLDTLERVIDTDLSVLIRGESGTGKELVAKAIHFNGPRKERPMVSLNCAALPESLIESELFGHARGAFTGADRAREGLFVQASGGTVFLDELGEMPLAMQAKLLRALQEREVRPIGSSEAIPVDVRVLAATNRDLPEEVAAGRFREDLYYRLGVIEIELPPLRDRPEDLLPLCEHFLGGEGPSRLTPGALAALRGHRWPGNVRELANVLARAQALATGERIKEEDLALDSVSEPLPSTREEFREDEATRIKRALAEHRWNVSAVSRALEIPRQTLYRRLRELGLRRPR